jgi:uncharacterized phosphosugar-binding protein
MTATAYLQQIQELLGGLNAATSEIERAAALCSECIAAGDVVHVFGAGHSRMAAEEAYPRIGGVVGFHPVVEMAVTTFHAVTGTNGLRQAMFLERVPDYGSLIFESLQARPSDVVLIFSNSGVEAIIMDFARTARNSGLKVIGVTSLAYSGAAASGRENALRLADVADVVIDNGVPVGDALISLDGLTERVAPSSSVLNLAIMNCITAETAARLLLAGVEPMVFGSPHLVGDERSRDRFDACLTAYDKRVVRRQ